VNSTVPRAQFRAAIRFEWGLPGAQAAGQPGGALVIVDVLSFSTAVTIGVGRGAAIYPHPWPSTGLEAFAAARNAVLALPRHQASPSHPWSLSPASLLTAAIPRRLVLPSPNGSAIAATATHASVLAGCLRNATAIARWLEHRGYGTPHRPAVIIAAGERWPAGELRPALEDLLGAGAIISALPPDRARSPEAAAAEALWRACQHQAGEFLYNCLSGQELVTAGYATDVILAAEHDAQATVPLLTGAAFRDTERPGDIISTRVPPR
jgi:2-phosphosulfolactate phosphatase